MSPHFENVSQTFIFSPSKTRITCDKILRIHRGVPPRAYKTRAHWQHYDWRSKPDPRAIDDKHRYRKRSGDS